MPSATRTRTAANEALSGPLVPRRPCDGPPSLKSEHLVRRNRPDVWDGPLARTSARRYGPGEPDLERVDLLSARDPDSPRQAALRERVPEAAAAAVCGIGEHDAPQHQHTI